MNSKTYARRVIRRTIQSAQQPPRAGTATLFLTADGQVTAHYGAPVETAARVIRIVVNRAESAGNGQ
jgi:hypothetical protein